MLPCASPEPTSTAGRGSPTAARGRAAWPPTPSLSMPRTATSPSGPPVRPSMRDGRQWHPRSTSMAHLGRWPRGWIWALTRRTWCRCPSPRWARERSRAVRRALTAARTARAGFFRTARSPSRRSRGSTRYLSGGAVPTARAIHAPWSSAPAFRSPRPSGRRQSPRTWSSPRWSIRPPARRPAGVSALATGSSTRAAPWPRPRSRATTCPSTPPAIPATSCSGGAARSPPFRWGRPTRARSP